MFYRKVILSLSATLIIKMQISICFAQWVNTGLEGGFHLSLGVSPVNSDFIMAGGDIKGGLYRSLDAAGNWEYSGQRMQSFMDFAFDPQDENIVFAGSNSGLFKSEDQGATWIKTGFNDTIVFSLHFNPLDPKVLYLGTGRQSMDGKGYGIYKSLDGGTSFKYAGLDSNLITEILVSDIDTSIILASSGSGVYKSENSGENWTKLGPSKDIWIGLPTGAITWDGKDTIYASTLYDVGSNYVDGTVYRSTNGGSTWDSVMGFKSSIEELEINPYDPDIVYAAIFESANVKMGVWRSVDAGASWEYQSNGITDVMIKDIAIDPANPSILYATGDGGGGIYKTTDAGDNWTAVNSGMTYFIGYQIKYLRVGSTDYIYAINSFGVYRTIPQIFRLDVSAGNWEPCGIMPVDTVPYNFTMFSIRDITQDPFNDSLLFVSGIAHSGGIFGHPATGLIYRSDDGGLSWQEPYSFESRQANTVTVTYNGPQQIILAGTENADSTCAVWKSTDGGQTFVPTSGWFKNVTVMDLKVDPFDSSHIVAGTIIGVMTSNDFGDSWEFTPAFDEDSIKLIYRILVDRNYEGRIFTANGGWLINPDTNNYAGVCWSTDGWNTRINGGLNDYSVTGLANCCDKLFAGTGGVYEIGGKDSISGHGIMYANPDETDLLWIPLDTAGMERKFILSLACFDSILYAGTFGGGVWKYDLRQIITQNEYNNIALNELQIWPNPFNSSVTISIPGNDLIKYSKAEILIFKTTGELIEKFIKTIADLNEGIIWNAGDAPEGAYLIKVIAGNGIYCNKLILIK